MTEKERPRLWVLAEEARTLVDPYPMPFWDGPVGLAQAVMGYLEDHLQAAAVSDPELVVAVIEEYWGPPGQRALWGDYTRERYERALAERAGDQGPSSSAATPWERAAEVVADPHASVFCAAVAALQDDGTTAATLIKLVRASDWYRAGPRTAKMLNLDWVASQLKPIGPPPLEPGEEIADTPL
jgi:hypothetical protein